MNIRDNVKRMCNLQGISQKQLAERMGITDNSLSMTLSKNNPQLSTLVNISQALGVSLSQLLAEPDELVPAADQNAEENGRVLRCPHCGREIELYVKAL